MFVGSKNKIALYCIFMQVILCNQFILSSNLSRKNMLCQKSFDMRHIDQSKIDPQEIIRFYVNSDKHVVLYLPPFDTEKIKNMYKGNNKEVTLYLPEETIKKDLYLRENPEQEPRSIVANLISSGGLDWKEVRKVFLDEGKEIGENKQQCEELIKSNLFFLSDADNANEGVCCVHSYNFTADFLDVVADDIDDVRQKKNIDNNVVLSRQKNCYDPMVRDCFNGLEKLSAKYLNINNYSQERIENFNESLSKFKADFEDIKNNDSSNLLKDQSKYMINDGKYKVLIGAMTGMIVEYFYKPILENNNQ